MRNVNVENKTGRLIAPDEVLAATALFYFEDALIDERYEECGELLQSAREFGATQSDISAIIAEFLTSARGSPVAEANRENSNRQRY